MPKNKMSPQKKHFLFRIKCADCGTESASQVEMTPTEAVETQNMIERAPYCDGCLDKRIEAQADGSEKFLVAKPVEA